MQLLLEENPKMYEFYANPRRRRRHHRRNPAMRLPVVGKWTQGVDMTDVAAGTAGFAASAMLPGMFIKPALGAELTTTQKWLKVSAAAVAAIAVGMLVKRFMSASAGKAAVIGGLAGTASQMINLLRPGTIASRGPSALLPRPGTRLGTSTVVSPSYSRESESVSLITP